MNKLGIKQRCVVASAPTEGRNMRNESGMTRYRTPGGLLADALLDKPTVAPNEQNPTSSATPTPTRSPIRTPPTSPICRR